jgi:hypothetical protein
LYLKELKWLCGSTLREGFRFCWDKPPLRERPGESRKQGEKGSKTTPHPGKASGRELGMEHLSFPEM